MTLRARHLAGLIVCATLIAVSSACERLRAPTRQEGRAVSSGDAATQPGAPGATRAGRPAPKGERVELVARHRLGVPVHPALDDHSVSARLPDGSWVAIVGRNESGRWLQIVSDTGIEGWITNRYAPAASEPARMPMAASSLERDSVWGSAAGCQRRVQGFVRARAPGKARIMSFNVRWFPDGVPGKRPGKRPTDLDWLACGLAASNADVVLLQEIKATKRARQKLAELIDKLDELTGGRFVVALDECPIESVQHVGVLYDSKRVKALDLVQYPALNPHGLPCKDQLRPGFGGYFKFQGGLDLHLISVHLKSGSKRRDHQLRLRALHGISDVLREAQRTHPDDDLVFGGDFNTMGCSHCQPEVSAQAERATFGEKLSLEHRLSLLPAQASCSEYFQGRGGLLDHFAVSRGVLKSTESLKTTVSGYCGELSCAAFGARAPAAYEVLSDHCPILIELDDRDDD